MTAYRFCRTDDIGLLVDALNRCWAPHFPEEPAMTPAVFKRSIRDLQVWCSSCMVALSGEEPVAVLIGAKRPSGTLVHRIAVHPDHCRRGHARHLLDSLASKLAILGPPRIVAEVPASLGPARGLFAAGGYVPEAVLTDYVLQPPDAGAGPPAAPGTFDIPITPDDLAANGLAADDGRPGCWHRAAETLAARKGEVFGRAVASEERIEAWILYTKPPAAGPYPAEPPGAEVLSLGTVVEDGAAGLRRLLAGVSAEGGGMVRFSRVHPAEAPAGLLEALRFRPAGAHVLYSGTARAH